MYEIVVTKFELKVFVILRYTRYHIRLNQWRRPDGMWKPGPVPALGVDDGKKIEWLLNISKCGFPVKKQELLDTIQKIIGDGELKNNFKDDRPGQVV